MSETLNAHIITIDGPSGVGKGTVARRLAQRLQWTFLDSGALYRITAYASNQKGISPKDVSALAQLASTLDVHFEAEKIFFEKTAIEEAIRSESIGMLASQIAAYPEVRQALIALQRAFLNRGVGLVADGRDMGTVLFPEAAYKFFLTAQSEERARRRFLQLQAQGIYVNIAELLHDINARDLRDQTRSASPLIPAKEALVIDTTHLSIDQVFAEVVHAIQAKSNQPIF